MMTRNWARPRNRVIETTLIALRRGYYLTVAEAAESVTRFDYQGKSPAIARALLQRDLAREYYAQYGGQSERTEEIAAMAAQLRAEGWRYIIGHRRDETGGLWRHDESGVTVNQNGGSFATFTEATVETYQSQTRQLINRRKEYA